MPTQRVYGDVMVHKDDCYPVRIVCAAGSMPSLYCSKLKGLEDKNSLAAVDGKEEESIARAVSWLN